MTKPKYGEYSSTKKANKAVMKCAAFSANFVKCGLGL